MRLTLFFEKDEYQTLVAMLETCSFNPSKPIQFFQPGQIYFFHYHKEEYNFLYKDFNNLGRRLR